MDFQMGKSLAQVSLLIERESAKMSEDQKKEFYDRLMLICEERGGL